ncbi:hypothetical protein D3P06_06630 [Paracoccus aestuarii]|uniref:Uncharacterized protein n=1 Tax=Paracoccus aestuarii TaxID=453842 RepID=A0A418ZY77_9RHOB|nr:hypothetical protein [Paracoccus aestuarii]RJL05509.1 hypothetical protein D3P06_06630 [Paracoccus aestuarii]WCQ98625.1 hypothetical protein JHW48_12105 [Paracoccus aestuarii]
MSTPTPKISAAQLEAMRHAMETLKPKPKADYTSREAITAMAQEIRRARAELGYSLEELAEILQPHGLAIRPSTLRGYLRKIEKEADDAQAATAAQPPRRARTKRSAPAAASTRGNSGNIVWGDLPDLTDEGHDIRPRRVEPGRG